MIELFLLKQTELGSVAGYSMSTGQYHASSTAAGLAWQRSLARSMSACLAADRGVALSWSRQGLMTQYQLAIVVGSCRPESTNLKLARAEQRWAGIFHTNLGADRRSAVLQSGSRNSAAAGIVHRSPLAEQPLIEAEWRRRVRSQKTACVVVSCKHAPVSLHDNHFRYSSRAGIRPASAASMIYCRATWLHGGVHHNAEERVPGVMSSFRPNDL